MTLIKSISGIRGTIGGKPGEGLSPLDIVKFASAYGIWLKKYSKKQKLCVVVGRDSRISGPMVSQFIISTLNGLGIDVINLGLATTPTVEMAVSGEHADGGIIVTASHNPAQWNALKLLNAQGEFIDDTQGKELLEIARSEEFEYAQVENLGKTFDCSEWDQKHIQQVLNLKLVNVEAITNANYTVAFDGINSVGGIILPQLLNALGVKNIIGLNLEVNGQFAHNPEPLPENVTQIMAKMKETRADIGFVVDPDVDRLAIISEDGSMFGEEYTLVSIADYVLKNTPGNTVSNLSSTRALRDVTRKYKQNYEAAAVGEVNVVAKMKQIKAIIGGEGNGGVIFPELHYGRDALVGIALFLSNLATSGKTCSQLRKEYPAYFMSKNKIELLPGVDVDAILKKITDCYSKEEINTIDGIKIDFPDSWVHLRKSNTEPIIRVYAEAFSKSDADELAKKFVEEIKKISSNYYS